MKYATIDKDGVKYKILAKKMYELGYPMSTTYANTLLIKTFEHIIFKVMKTYNCPIDKKRVRELAKSPEFQNTLAPIIRTLYKDNEL